MGPSSGNYWKVLPWPHCGFKANGTILDPAAQIAHWGWARAGTQASRHKKRKAEEEEEEEEEEESERGGSPQTQQRTLESIRV